MTEFRLCSSDLLDLGQQHHELSATFFLRRFVGVALLVMRLALVGTALQNASLGARVAIRLDRGRRFAGIATGRHTVRLD